VVRRRLPLLLLATGLVLALAPIVVAEEDSEAHVRGSSPLEPDHVITVPGAPDPHGDAGLCAECHGADPSAGPQPRGPSCERCHPDTSFHVVDIEPKEIKVPEKMLLQEGQMTCATCHDEPACDGLPKDGRGEDHFRGGPYTSKLALCFECHDRDEFERTDPHRDLQTADGRRNDAVCIFCHQAVPEDAADQEVQSLRVDPVTLCKGCHAHQIHVGIPSHLVIAKGEVRELVDAYNVGHEFPIPLGPRGEITCTTCHDPHPGLEPLPVATSPEALETMRQASREYRDSYYLPRLREELGQIVDDTGYHLTLTDGPRNKDGLLRVPAEDGTLCLICHDMGNGR